MIVKVAYQDWEKNNADWIFGLINLTVGILQQNNYNYCELDSSIKINLTLPLKILILWY